MPMVSAGRVRGVVVVSLAVAACGDDSATTGEWAGTVHDSAGIAVVVNPAADLWTPTTAWRLEEDLRIGVAHGDQAREFGRIAGIAVNGSDQIHVLDRQAGEIRVFDANGEFVRTIGRARRGPGELNSPSAVLIGRGDTILVPDMTNQRVQRFLSDGSDAGAFPLRLSDGIPLAWHIREDGLLLNQVRTLPGGQAGADDERILVLARAVDGEVRDTLVELPVGEAMVLRSGQPQMTVFAPEPLWTPLTGGRIANGRNAEYRLEIRASDGRLERVVRKPFSRRRFDESDRRALRELLRQQFEQQGPSPATDRLLQSLKGDHIYGIQRDGLGVQYVVRLRVVR